MKFHTQENIWFHSNKDIKKKRRNRFLCVSGKNDMSAKPFDCFPGCSAYTIYIFRDTCSPDKSTFSGTLCITAGTNGWGL